MANQVPFGPDDLTRGAYQLWHYSARQYMDQHKVDLTEDLGEDTWQVTTNLPNRNANYFYRMLDGTALFNISALYIAASITDYTYEIIDLLYC